jgi:hypothetical protein
VKLHFGLLVFGQIFGLDAQTSFPQLPTYTVTIVEVEELQFVIVIVIVIVIVKKKIKPPHIWEIS